MSMTHGMNVEQVRHLGNLMKTKAEEIRQIMSQLDSQLHNTSWEGPDATAFKGSQWPEHRGHLNTVAVSLDGFGQSALNNAAEQENTSGH